MKFLITLLFVLPCFGQVDVSKWYLVNGITNNGGGNIDCGKPAAVTTTGSGLQIVTQSASLTCGGFGWTPTPLNWQSGYLVSNNFACSYCNVIVVGTFPSPTRYNNTGIWMAGTNCWLKEKLSAHGANPPPCHWHYSGSREIDVIQSVGPSDQYLGGFALNDSTQDSAGCLPLTGQPNSAQHTYEMDWTSSALTWKIDGTQVCTESTQIPESPMFLMIVNMIQGAAASNNTVTVNSITVIANSNTQVCTASGSCTAVSSGVIFSDNFPGTVASQVWVSENGGGNYTGLDAADPLPLYVPAGAGGQVQFFNDAGWWTNGVIGNGTAIHFMGNAATYTTPPQIPPAGSGVGAIVIPDDPSLVELLQTATARTSSVVYTLASKPSIDHAETASGFGAFVGSAAPGSWIEIYGSNLAVDSRTWTLSDFNGPNAPSMLDGTSVTIGGQQAVLSYISQGQVNAQVPMNLPAGQQAVVVTNIGGTSTAYLMTINSTEPGLCETMVNGAPYIVTVINGTQTYIVPSQPAQPGQILNFFGTGFGPVTPAPPAGQAATQLNQLMNALQIQIGGVTAQVMYGGLAPGAIGLYQFNVVVPNVPAGDKVPVSFTLNGLAGTQTLYTAIQ